MNAVEVLMPSTARAILLLLAQNRKFSLLLFSVFCRIE
jgi:hypothetical protein